MEYVISVGRAGLLRSASVQQRDDQKIDEKLKLLTFGENGYLDVLHQFHRRPFHRVIYVYIHLGRCN